MKEQEPGALHAK